MKQTPTTTPLHQYSDGPRVSHSHTCRKFWPAEICMKEEHSKPFREHTPSKAPAYCHVLWHEYFYISLFVPLILIIWKMPICYSNHRVVPIVPWAYANLLDDSKSGPIFPMELGYPWSPEPLPSWACAIVVISIPPLIISIFQFKSRNTCDFHAGFSGALKAVITTTLVCTILKQVIGGFRPYSMEACKPDPALIIKDLAVGQYWFNAAACSGDSYEVKKAMQSFPSGHTANSFASAAFISLYLNGKLKPFADRPSYLPTLIATISPMIGAAVIAGSMYISHHHHASDIVFGIIIGTSLGLLAYRSGYATVLDFHSNHIPLLHVSTCTFLRPEGHQNVVDCSPSKIDWKHENTSSMLGSDTIPIPI